MTNSEGPDQTALLSAQLSVSIPVLKTTSKKQNQKKKKLSWSKLHISQTCTIKQAPAFRKAVFAVPLGTCLKYLTVLKIPR